MSQHRNLLTICIYTLGAIRRGFKCLGGGVLKDFPACAYIIIIVFAPGAPRVLKGSENKRNKVEGIIHIPIYFYRDLVARSVDFNSMIFYNSFE